MLVFVLALGVGGFVARAADPAPSPVPTEAELDAITARGVLLFQLDQIAWHGTDAIMLRGPELSRFDTFIAHQSIDGVHCAFGKLTGDGTTFLTAYESTTDAPDSTKGIKVAVFDPPREDSGWLAQAARALQAARKVFAFSDRDRYNYVLVPEKDGSVSVYFIVTTTDGNVLPLGGDGVVNVSPTGETRMSRFHNAVMYRERIKDPQWGTHSHVIECLPNPTDVFFVLTWTKVPEVVTCKDRMYVIGPDGRILIRDWSPEAKTNAGAACAAAPDDKKK